MNCFTIDAGLGIFKNTVEFKITNMSVKIKQDNNAAEIGLEDQNPIFQAWKEIKDSIFNVLFVLLDKNDDDGDQSMFGLIFESGLDYLQMMVFPFEVAVIAVWNGGDTLSNVTSLFSKFNLSTYLPGISFSTFLIMVYVLIFIIIMVLLDIIYVSYSFSKKKFRFTWPLVLLAQIVPLFVTVLFLPITETLFSVVQCSTDQVLGKQVMSSYPEVVCWEGWHLFHSVITLLFSSIFVFISSIVGLALFEPRMTTNKLTARQNSTGQIVFIVNKIVTQFVFSFTPFDGTWIYCIMLFVLSGWLFWTYNMHDPYYEKNASKFFRIASTYYFWTNCMLMVSQILLSVGFNGGLVIWLSGLPFIWVVIVFDKQSNIDKLFSSNLKFRTGDDLEAHLKYVLQLIQNQEKDKNSYMLLIGYIQKHKQVCTEEDCPLKVVRRKKDPNAMEESAAQLIKQLQRMYKTGIKKYPNCTRLRLSLAFFYLQRMKDKKKAYEEFSNAGKTDPAFQQEFIIYRFKKIIRENLEDDKQNNSDLIEIIRFDNHVSLCQEGSVLSARLHKEFWLQLKEEIPDLKKLNKIGSKITQTVNIVRENYKQIQKINDSVPEVLHNFALYLMFIQQDASQGRQLLMNARKILQQKMLAGEQKVKKNLDLDNIEQEDEGSIVIVSGRSGSVGKMTKVNLLFIELTGYPKEELCDRGIEKILPDCIVSHHENCIQEWFKDDNAFSSYLNNQRRQYIRHKSGFLVPVIYKVTFLPEQEEFLTLFKQDASRSSHCSLLVDDDCNILDTTVMGYSYFGFDKANITERKLRLQDLGLNFPFDQSLMSNKGADVRLGEDLKSHYNVKVNPIKITRNSYREEVEEEDQESGFLAKKHRIIGYVVQILQVAKEKKTFMEGSNYQVGESVDHEGAIMGLYNSPGVAALLAANLTKTEQNQVHQFVNYGQEQKIKTMRLLNNEIKMVYNQENDDYCDQDGKDGLGDDDYQMFKIDDQNYQKKIKQAINTNLNHVQVSYLKWFSLLFLFILFAAVITHLIMALGELSRVQDFDRTYLYKAQQTNFLLTRISNTFAYNFTQDPVDPMVEAQIINNHTIEYSSNAMVPLKLQDGKFVYKQIKDAFIYLESQLAQYAQWRDPETLNNIFYNFIKNMYPILLMNFDSIEISLLFSYALLAGTGLLGVIMTVVWVYILLLIDKKRFDIMIWFLDIPIPYVGFLGNQCDNYLKGFVGVKQLMEKGINLDQKEYHFESYSQKTNQNEQELEQQQKARKTLIARHKKDTLLSKLDCKYVKYFWIVIFAALFSTISHSTSSSAVNLFQFLKGQWQSSYRQLLWDGTLDLSFYIRAEYGTPIPDVAMDEFLDKLQKNYLNGRSQYQLIEFSRQIMDFQLAEVAMSFQNVHRESLCIGVANESRCESLLDGKLKGGYAIFSKYLYQATIDRRREYRDANHLYVAPAFLNMMESWRSAMNEIVLKAISLSSIMLYVYIIVSALGFLTVWMIYLRKLNTGINQTIQMLNMIPLRLLPKSRRETRQFIIWIIGEANKKQHQQE